LGVRVAVNGTDREAVPSFDEPARQGRLYISRLVCLGTWTTRLLWGQLVISSEWYICRLTVKIVRCKGTDWVPAFAAKAPLALNKRARGSATPMTPTCRTPSDTTAPLTSAPRIGPTYSGALRKSAREKTSLGSGEAPLVLD